VTSNVSAVNSLARDLTLYTLGRLALVAAVTAVVVGFPLGLLVFRGLNQRVTVGLAERGEQRAATRERLRAELRGEEPEE
jgi:hypothetical protein